MTGNSMTQIQAVKQALANLPRCLQKTDGFTTKEYANEQGIRHNTASQQIRVLFDAGIIEATTRKAIKDMSGRIQMVPAYRLVKGKK